MTIISLLEQIERGEIVLPAIQRDFVWSRSKIEKLMDSVMRGFPIGIVFLWETYNDLTYRHFVTDHASGGADDFFDNAGESRFKLVLDGQQRLQSLYLALYGSYEGKYLYFDVLSGRDAEDYAENKFTFGFMSADEAERKNSMSVSQSNEHSESLNACYFCRVGELISLGAWDRQKLQQKISEDLKIDDEEELRLGYNFTKLRDVLFSDRNILKVTVIDEYKPRSSGDRKSEADVLEAFVRINREATSLKKSEFFFGMLKLHWRESSEDIQSFLNSLDGRNPFGLDSDLVLRCLLVVSDLGTKFDLDVLRKKDNIDLLRNNFSKCTRAIKNVVKFVREECSIRDKKLLKTTNNLIPLVYYVFHQSRQRIPKHETNSLVKALYFFSFALPFSTKRDRRIGEFISDVLRPSLRGKGGFPLDETVSWIFNLEDAGEFGPEFLQRNPALAARLVQDGLSGVDSRRAKTVKVDTIFRVPELKKRGYLDDEAYHFANYWVPPSGFGRDKKGMKVKEMFDNVEDSLVNGAFIDRNLLDYEKYDKFLKYREDRIVTYLNEKLGF